MIGHNYTANKISDKIKAGFVYCVYQQYANDTREKGEIVSFHKSHTAANGRCDKAGFLAVKHLNEVLTDLQYREDCAANRF